MRRVNRLLISLAFSLGASTGLAFAKDSVTIGMVLEPTGLDPTAGAAAAIGEVALRLVEFAALFLEAGELRLSPLVEGDVAAGGIEAGRAAEAAAASPGLS